MLGDVLRPFLPGHRAPSVPFEILHFALMLLGSRARRDRAEVAALPGLGMLLARIEPIFAGCQLSEHTRTNRPRLGGFRCQRPLRLRASIVPIMASAASTINGEAIMMRPSPMLAPPAKRVSESCQIWNVAYAQNAAVRRIAAPQSVRERGPNNPSTSIGRDAATKCMIATSGAFIDPSAPSATNGFPKLKSVAALATKTIDRPSSSRSEEKQSELQSQKHK